MSENENPRHPIAAILDDLPDDFRFLKPPPAYEVTIGGRWPYQAEIARIDGRNREVVVRLSETEIQIAILKSYLHSVNQ